MTETIQHKIIGAIKAWSYDIHDLNNHREIIAISFGIQKVYDGFEVYLSGHSWFDGNDLWLLDEKWKPKQNYISLGQDSLNYDRLEILKIYEKAVYDEIKTQKDLYKNFIVVVSLVDGESKRLK
jgi:hypothetical protein